MIQQDWHNRTRDEVDRQLAANADFELDRFARERQYVAWYATLWSELAVTVRDDEAVYLPTLQTEVVRLTHPARVVALRVLVDEDRASDYFVQRGSWFWKPVSRYFETEAWSLGLADGTGIQCISAIIARDVATAMRTTWMPISSDRFLNADRWPAQLKKSNPVETYGVGHVELEQPAPAPAQKSKPVALAAPTAPRETASRPLFTPRSVCRGSSRRHSQLGRGRRAKAS